jgi:DNA-binding HxlR family transcriptional regulator
VVSVPAFRSSRSLSAATSLNDRLRDLVRLGFVVRRAYPGPPLSSCYEATRAGRVLGEQLPQMVVAAQQGGLLP